MLVIDWTKIDLNVFAGLAGRSRRVCRKMGAVS
jgi:hypothetical protein